MVVVPATQLTLYKRELLYTSFIDDT